jgi:hypothetical protein
MRIISIRPAPVARLFALTYAICGLGSFVVWTFTSLQTYYLPVGLVMGIFHLTMNFQIGRSPDLLANAFLCVGSILSYALTGWITGVVLTLCLNFIAQKTGGIDAKFVSVADGDSAPSS